MAINAITKSNKPDDTPALIFRRAAYQSLVGSIGWLTLSTRPDLAQVYSFLSSCNNKTSSGHLNAVIYFFCCIHSTYNYSITFTSEK